MVWNDLGPNAGVLGQPGSRYRLSLPALLLDLDALEHNISLFADTAASAGLSLRPHFKATKSLAIARRQREAGAIGNCCATLGEAEVLSAGGLDNVLLTSTVTSTAMVERLVALNLRSNGLIVVVDNAENVTALDEAARRTDKPLGVLVEFDVAQGRTGVRTSEEAVRLAAAVAAAPHLNYRGIQAYYGLLQHVADQDYRERLVHEQAVRIRELVDLLGRAGLKPQVISGGGTGTFPIDVTLGLFTESQSGSYPVMDREYFDIEMRMGNHKLLPALYVGASVISTPEPGLAIVNAGYKSFATEGPLATIASPTLNRASYRLMGDEHGGVSYEGTGPSLGSTIEFLAPHCDPTVNLYDRYHCIRGDRLVEIWPIEGRGA